MRSLAHSFLDEFDLAILDAKAAIQGKREEYWPQTWLAFAYSLSGKQDAARAAFDRARELKPELSTIYLRSRIGTMHPAYFDNILVVLKKLGLPE